MENTQSQRAAALGDRIWRFFASVRLTVVVLLSLAATSIIGTLIPQNQSHAAYIQTYGEQWYRLFLALDFFDMYHAWWFQLLLLLLTANIVVCSIDRLSATWKIIFIKTPHFNRAHFEKAKNRQDLRSKLSPEALQASVTEYLKKEFSYLKTEPLESGYCLFAEKGRKTRLGAYIVHASVILLVVGGLLGSLFGFEGFVNIPEGATVENVRLRDRMEPKPLDFALRCEDFKVSFYDSGMPKEYRSTLTVIEDGKAVFTRDIIVNDPLRYRGISFYQSSYGTLPSKTVTLDILSKASGMSYQKTVTLGEPFALPEGLGRFVLKDFKEEVRFMGRAMGQGFVAEYLPPEGEPEPLKLLLRFPRFDAMRKGAFVVSVADYEPRYYTGLQVTKDPGVWVVYAGFVVMIAGIFVTFFLSHQRVCVKVSPDPESGSQLMVAGTSDRHRGGIELKVRRIAAALSRIAETSQKEEKSG